MTLRDIHKRFITNYRTKNGGINLYPQFDYDLEALLHFLGETDGLYLEDIEMSDVHSRPVENSFHARED